jgi:hypothetical protein
MGKVPKPKYSKGGMIRKIAGRHYFDDGGSTTLTGPTGSNTGQSSATVNNNGLTGTVGNALGLNNQFQAQSAPIQAGTNVGQLQQAYTGAQGGLNQQQQLASQVAPGTQQGLGTQAALTGQLQGVINGTGPNAAQTALAQNTATNVANQAAMAAGQRGASSNVGLLARQAAQTGAATQQAAVGQAATTQAQQQIAAQEQLGNLASTQVGQGATAVQGVNNAQQNEQNILQGANTAANNANVGMQSNINSVNAGVAAGNQQQAGNVVSGIGNALSNVPVIGSFFKAKGGEIEADGFHHCAGAKCTDRAHYAHMMAEGGPLQVNAPPPEQIGPWLNSGNTEPGAPNVAAAPNTPQLANPFQKSGSSSSTPDAEEDGSPSGAESGLGMPSGSAGALSPADEALAGWAKGGKIDWHSHFAGGGKVEAMVSPGEIYLPPEDVEKVIKRGDNPLKLGTKFKGKASVRGDSLKNDTIPATLQEGGVVIPRHVMSKKSRDHAELFVRRAVHMRAPKGGK